MAANVPDIKGATQGKRTITLTSSDNHEFVISEPVAFLSEKIKKIVEDNPTVSVIHVPFADRQTLAKVVYYLNKQVEGGSSAVLDEELVSGKEFKDLLDLSKVAFFLKVKGLRDIVSQKIADRMMDKIVEGIREALGIVNDYTLEEEEELRQKDGWACEGRVDPKDD